MITKSVIQMEISSSSLCHKVEWFKYLQVVKDQLQAMKLFTEQCIESHYFADPTWRIASCK